MNNVTIIAEAGVNHNGSIKLAKQLIDVAESAGADYVKFQTFKAEEGISQNTKKAEYQIDNTENEVETQLEMVKKLELSDQDHFELIDYCKDKKIRFLSTAFDFTSIDFLKKVGLDFFKIPSGEITNYPYLVKVAQLNLPIVMSTGMASMKEVEEALEILIKNGSSKDEITILHCNTEYPTPMLDVNLKAMNTIRDNLGVQVGYSDHTLGIEVPIAAVAMGATTIEKHFTLDKTMKGPDHLASLEPDELRNMVNAIRNIEKAISGNGIKEPSKSEKKNKFIIRKSIHLKDSIEKGEIIKEKNLIVLRPSVGISPMDWNKVIGKKVAKDLLSGNPLKWTDIDE